MYTEGMGGILASYCLAILSIAAYGAYCFFENRRRDRLESARSERVHEDTDFKDMTDRENIRKQNDEVVRLSRVFKAD